jgi:hydroxymethylpyrimidine/phosphomethylpyrimidine kinase
VRTALTIAGSDSGGGAGIQADLKTFAAHGVFGMTAITAITAQNTRGVTRVDLVPVDGLVAQLDAVFADLPVHVVKIGMLGTAAHAAATAAFLRGLGAARPPVVFDPVMVATSGHRLLDADAERILRDELLPLCAVATPNLHEAPVLLGGTAPVDAARRSGASILVTGGDADSDVIVDALYAPDGSVRRWEGPRLGPGVPIHGTGCSLASAIAARIARGAPVLDAVDGAIAWVRGEVDVAVRLGGGSAVLGHRPAR